MAILVPFVEAVFEQGHGILPNMRGIIPMKHERHVMRHFQSSPASPSPSSEKAVHLPGIKPVLELLQSSPERVDTLYIRKGLRSEDASRMLDICRQDNIRFSFVEESVLHRLCKSQHQGVVARLGAVAHVPLDSLLIEASKAPLPIILALDHVKDPGNVGTLVRTLYALGGAGIVIPKHNSAYLGDAARKASAGALDNVSICSVTNLGHALDAAEESGFALVGTGVRAQSPHCHTINAFTEPLPLPAMLVLGSEDKGLRPSIAKRCAFMVHIPLVRQFDSLNVAQAGAILLGLLAKQHA